MFLQGTRIEKWYEAMQFLTIREKIEPRIFETLHQREAECIVLAEQADIGQRARIDVTVYLPAGTCLLVDNRHFDAVSRGTVEMGPTVDLCYVDQDRADMNPEHNVWQEITDGADELTLGKQKVNSRAYVSKFNFRGADQQQLVGNLSGGQRNRVQLAKMLRQGGNLLLVDEPTNDLDVDTIRVLEEALEGFAGSAIVVSHDRFFLDKVATHILSFEEGGGGRFWEGNYSTYRERRREEGADADGRGGKHRRMT